jgi:L-2-hydroxyglutarate oxidase LhgO
MVKIKDRYECMIFDPPALRITPYRISKFLMDNFSKTQKMVFVYPRKFVKEIQELFEYFSLKSWKKAEYVIRNEFNQKEMEIFVNFEDSTCKSSK